ncbi:octaprenyl diphosphate synthase [Permianibacter aggregans]|uniref:Octaprenyl diphosphate synthase n=1 Tax=Permianibacter aggregans TaxID=1510150 RepID=A0A4V3D849_9GAMM|nr:octaprenyl diphosphate synthase [Permianibacter aggregans]QGX38584.1 octaprenyl diphosphate synthase [Permianibacter aggregans]TDQ50367.1 octaprenyl-diphosphate synthase [Permianibacter aggregans]
MDIDAVRALVKDDIAATDALILEKLQSEVVLVNQLGYYIINSGGKRLRPLLLLLAARGLGYQGKHHHTLAAVIEFIHTATLLHDDVVDASDMRRGRQTANAVFGNEASVLVGDYLYSRAFQMMVEVGEMRVMDILSTATNVIAEGEVMQLMNCNDPDTTEQRYFDVITCKTAKLFEAALQLSAVLAKQSPEVEAAMAGYGMELGIAFQLIDDALDYSGDSGELGKNVGDDLAEGKPTLPLIHAMRHGKPEQVALIRQAIENGGTDQFDEIRQTLSETGAIEYTEQKAEKAVAKAKSLLQNMPPSPYREALIAVAEYAISRRS